jgi:nicotinamidase-related amidase
MGLQDIEKKKTAILFFDLLNGYYHGEEEEIKVRLNPMVDNAVRLMKAGREVGIPIIFAQGGGRTDGSTSALVLSDTNYGRPWPGGVVTRGKQRVVHGEWSSQVIPELDPRPEDYYIPKQRWSAFHQTVLDLTLRALGIDTVIISGASTFVGIAATVYQGRDLDYNVIIVREACCAPRDSHVHDIMMDVVFPRMGRVRITDDVLTMIREAKN